VLEKLWQHISVNFIIKLPVSRGYDSILIVYNKLKILYFITIIKKITIEGLVSQIRYSLNRNNWYC